MHSLRRLEIAPGPPNNIDVGLLLNGATRLSSMIIRDDDIIVNLAKVVGQLKSLRSVVCQCKRYPRALMYPLGQIEGKLQQQAASREFPRM